MYWLETYGKEIVALLVPVITWVLNSIFKAKAKLVFANPHAFSFLIPQPLLDEQQKQIAPSQAIHTRSLMVGNVGKETATKLEWVFNWKPPCLNVWPARRFSDHLAPDGRYTIVFESLAPNEYLGCEILSVNGELPLLLTVRSDQCVATNIAMYPQPVMPAWRKRGWMVLAFAGLAAIVYVAILLLQFLILKTPFGR